MVNVMRQMVPLFSQVDSNKLRHDVQHEQNVIYAQFGKDLFNISKVIGRKKWPRLKKTQTHSVYCVGCMCHCRHSRYIGHRPSC